MLDNSGKLRYPTFWELSGLGMEGKPKKLMDKGWKIYTISDFTHYELKCVRDFISAHKGKAKLIEADFFTTYSEHFELDYTCPEHNVGFIDYETAHKFADMLMTLPQRETILLSLQHARLKEFRAYMEEQTDVGWFECNEDMDEGHFVLISSYDRRKLMECKLRWA